MLKKEFTYFCTALMFFTRIPIPFELEYSEEIMNKSQKYYSAVGLVVGILNALVFGIGSYLFTPNIGIVLSLIVSVLITGGFHEDGFTDVCDSFGGGYGKEKIMTIMKDSRIGAYGVLGMILLLLLKFTCLQALVDIDIATIGSAIIIAHSSSRFLSGLMIHSHDYVTDIDVSKSKPLANKPIPLTATLWGLCLAVIPLVLLMPLKFLWILPIGYLGKWYLGWYFKKHIGGYTGDCLGTVQQVCEVLIYLGFILIWKFT
ncbi:MAG: adenosylcobinamide-GDP ribazoletransferase [Flavobacterium sp.]|nr:adenosylcobinamide-GDP ribazoletransferase [Candidatus Neoflavobacterium equi]